MLKSFQVEGVELIEIVKVKNGVLMTAGVSRLKKWVFVTTGEMTEATAFLGCFFEHEEPTLIPMTNMIMILRVTLRCNSYHTMPMMIHITRFVSFLVSLGTSSSASIMGARGDTTPLHITHSTLPHLLKVTIASVSPGLEEVIPATISLFSIFWRISSTDSKVTGSALAFRKGFTVLKSAAESAPIFVLSLVTRKLFSSVMEFTLKERSVEIVDS